MATYPDAMSIAERPVRQSASLPARVARRVKSLAQASKTSTSRAIANLIESGFDAREQAYVHIGRHPATGSPRYAHELDLPGLRSWPLTRYPHPVFYIERSDHIDVWRVLHGQRDVPAWLLGDMNADTNSDL